MKIFGNCFEFILLALAPIPKLQEGAQVLFLLLLFLGIGISPTAVFDPFTLGPTTRLSLLLGFFSVLLFVAGFRLQLRLNIRPITLEFERWMSTIRFRSYKKVEGAQHNEFKIDLKLRFRPINNDTHRCHIKGFQMTLMKKRFLRKPEVINDLSGFHLLRRIQDNQLVSFLYDPIPIEPKSVGLHYDLDRTFDIDSLGLLLINKEKYFFRVIMEAVSQPDLVIDVIPDWDFVPLDEGTLEHTVKTFHFRH